MGSNVDTNVIKSKKKERGYNLKHRGHADTPKNRSLYGHAPNIHTHLFKQHELSPYSPPLSPFPLCIYYRTLPERMYKKKQTIFFKFIFYCRCSFYWHWFQPISFSLTCSLSPSAGSFPVVYASLPEMDAHI